MAEEPTRGPASGGARDTDRGEPGERASRERSGPVAVTRHLKDDGRALLLYTRVDRGTA
jgi:hypothetical protein